MWLWLFALFLSSHLKASLCSLLSNKITSHEKKREEGRPNEITNFAMEGRTLQREYSVREREIKENKRDSV